MEKYIQQVTHAEDISREKTKFLISLNLFLSEEDFIVNIKVFIHICTGICSWLCGMHVCDMDKSCALKKLK